MEYSSRKHYFENDSLNELLRKPNNYQNFKEILKQIEYQLYLSGNAYIITEREGFELKGMKIVPSGMVNVYTHSNGISHYTYDGKNYEVDDVIHFKTLWLSDKRSQFVGTPKLKNEISLELGTEISIIEGANEAHRSGGETPHILVGKNIPAGSNDRTRHIKDQYNEQVSSRYQIKGLLPGDVELLQISDPRVVTKLIDKVGLPELQDMIMRKTQVPKTLIDYSFNGKAAAAESLYSFNTILINQLIDDRLETFNSYFQEHTNITEELIADYYQLDSEEALRADIEFKLANGLITLHEAQEMLGLEQSGQDKRFIKAGLLDFDAE